MQELGLFKFNDEDMKMENVDNLKTDAESVFTAPQERRYILNIIDNLAKCSEFNKDSCHISKGEKGERCFYFDEPFCVFNCDIGVSSPSNIAIVFKDTNVAEFYGASDNGISPYPLNDENYLICKVGLPRCVTNDFYHFVDAVSTGLTNLGDSDDFQNETGFPTRMAREIEQHLELGDTSDKLLILANALKFASDKQYGRTESWYKCYMDSIAKQIIDIAKEMPSCGLLKCVHEFETDIPA